MDGLFSRAVTG